MIILSREQIIALHTQLISETGGTDGLRDEGLLDSFLALNGIELDYTQDELSDTFLKMAAGRICRMKPFLSVRI